MSKKNISRINELINDSRKIRNVAVYGINSLLEEYLCEDDMSKSDLPFFLDEMPYPRYNYIDFLFSKFHQYDGEEFLINLIDISLISLDDALFEFLACDGMLFVVDAFDGIDYEMEMVIRHALKANVKPLIFIDNIEKLINELKLNSNDLQAKLNDLVSNFNKFISINANSDKKEEWQLDFEGRSVIFGSTENNLALNIPMMHKNGLKFDDVIKFLEKDDAESGFPVSDGVYDMIMGQVPSPYDAQKYRIPELWMGDIESEEGQAMLKADSDGPFTAVIVYNKRDSLGIVSVCRILSGTLQKGDEVCLVDFKSKARIKYLAIPSGSRTVSVKKVPAGSLAYIFLDVKDVINGEKLCLASKDLVGFKHDKHVREQAFIMSIEAENERDYPKLFDFLRSAKRKYPHFDFNINENVIITAISEAHLKKTVNMIKDSSIDINVLFGPDVIYKESILSKAGPVETRSPNKQNIFSIEVEPLDECILKALDEGIFKESDFKTAKPRYFMDKLSKDELIEIEINHKTMAEKFTQLGMDCEEANRVWSVYNRNMFLDMTEDIQHMDEAKDLIIETFEDLVKEGPLFLGCVNGLKFKLVDARLHEDGVHRGPAQVVPAVRNALNALIMLAGPCLLEPIQKVFIYTPARYAGECSRQIENNCGIIVRRESSGDFCEIECEIPVSKIHECMDGINSIAEGNEIAYPDRIVDFKKTSELPQDTVEKIRKRKGLSDNPSCAEDYLK